MVSFTTISVPIPVDANGITTLASLNLVGMNMGLPQVLNRKQYQSILQWLILPNSARFYPGRLLFARYIRFKSSNCVMQRHAQRKPPSKRQIHSQNLTKRSNKELYSHQSIWRRGGHRLVVS